MNIKEAIIMLEKIKNDYGNLNIEGYGQNDQCIFRLQGLEVTQYDDCDEYFVLLDCHI